MTCHKNYSSVLKALAKNYPASGLVCPDYAADAFAKLLSQTDCLSMSDSQGMQQGFQSSLLCFTSADGRAYLSHGSPF